MTLKPLWQLGFSTAIMMAISACSQEPAPASVAIPPTPASIPHTNHTMASSPEAASTPTSHTSQNDCEIALNGTDAMQFSLKQIEIPAHCTQATIHLSHTGKLPKTAMGHNVVITSQAHLRGVLSDGLQAGKEHEFVKPNDERVLAHSKLLGGGESDSITFDTALLKTEPYVFVCSFPGHSGPMRGTIVIQ
ncbi:azurin [Vitreoscilla stercoraria]|nr:azurin [Vitreoscilla stercoraria]